MTSIVIYQNSGQCFLDNSSSMNVITASKLLIVAFVGSVTLWYFITPYIVQPHKGIVNDILSRSTLINSLPKKNPDSSGAKLEESNDYIAIENWTKWRIYVRQKPEDTPQVIYARTGENISFLNQAVMNMEWRSEYEIQVGDTSTSKNSAELSVAISTPSSSWSKWGIYNHFETIVTGRTIRIVPRFLFGLHVETIEAIYGAEDTVAKIPIVGVFTDSPNLDRIIIQTYMNIVTLSVIFLLWANNPPDTLVGK
eukprot:06885.XXX_83612_79963_1 [CDS] Oithona nana genome sequencing.